MATLGQNGKVTLLDIAQSMDPQGKVADVAELLTQTNEILLDMPWFEGNLPTGHQGTIRTGLPTAVWRQFYQGVPPSKSQRAKITDACAMLETRSEVDVDEANLNGNASAFRLSEATAFVEGLNQTMADSLIYGNATVNPERFNGLAPRYSAISGATNGQNIIDAGGTGSDNTSIWLVVWGKQTAFGIYPKGSQAGLTHKDLGEYDAFDANQNRFRAYGDLWQWKCGLHVKDWRYVVRIANIDRSLLSATIATGADLPDLMSDAVERLPSIGPNATFYMDRDLRQVWRKQMAYKLKDSTLSLTDIGGVRSPTYHEIPIRRVDRLAVDEARVV